MGLKHGPRKARSPLPTKNQLKKPSGHGYDPRVLLVACPHCGQGVGEHCVRTSQGSWSDYGKPMPSEMENPHPVRVAAAR